jgi:diadenosine tetraphosphate (Ap4A) HIT family hydrolase
VDSCWFCLSNPKVEKHLIVSIGTEIYATLAKGPVISSTDVESKVPGLGHILLIPITHYPTFGKIPMESQIEVVAELEKYKSSIRRMFDKYDQDLVLFEVSRESFTGMTHAHIQIVPVPRSKSDQVEKVAREQAALNGMDLIDQVPVSKNLIF